MRLDLRCNRKLLFEQRRNLFFDLPMLIVKLIIEESEAQKIKNEQMIK